jgi:hypothetical protein
MKFLFFELLAVLVLAALRSKGPGLWHHIGQTNKDTNFINLEFAPESPIILDMKAVSADAGVS